MTDTLKTRRDFLKSSATTVGAVGLASACASCAWFNKKDVQLEANPSATNVRLAYAQYPKLKEPDGLVRVEAKDGDVRMIVLRLKDGKVMAISMVCTHWGCDIDWIGPKSEFECDCHGSRFDATGKVLEGPAEDPLKTWAVTEDEEGLTVDLTRGPQN